MRYFLTLIFILNIIPALAHNPADDPIFRSQLNNIQWNAYQAKQHYPNFEDCEDIEECEEMYDDYSNSQEKLQREIDNFNSYVNLHYIYNHDED